MLQEGVLRSNSEIGDGNTNSNNEDNNEGVDEDIDIPDDLGDVDVLVRGDDVLAQNGSNDVNMTA